MTVAVTLGCKLASFYTLISDITGIPAFRPIP